jgi:hypothetical protein
MKQDVQKTNLKFVDEEIDKVNKIYELATLEMCKQVDHEGRNKVSDLGTCGGEDARKGKPGLRDINVQLLNASQRDIDIRHHERP